jgi:HAD superfamily hydrolase (TIGR01509 family)
MQAVIFDMDGVIIDSETHFRELETATFKKLMPRWTPEAHERIVGLGIGELHAFLVREYALKTAYDEFMEHCRTIGTEVYQTRASLTPGFLSLVDELESSGVPIGLATSSPNLCVDMVMARFGLRDRFAALASADDAGAGKPSPKVYLLAARRLGVEPGRCAAIEDSRLGVLSATGAGMFCVGFRNGVNAAQDLSGASLEVYGFSELAGGRLSGLFTAR